MSFVVVVVVVVVDVVWMLVVCVLCHKKEFLFSEDVSRKMWGQVEACFIIHTNRFGDTPDYSRIQRTRGIYVGLVLGVRNPACRRCVTVTHLQAGATMARSCTYLNKSDRGERCGLGGNDEEA